MSDKTTTKFAHAGTILLKILIILLCSLLFLVGVLTAIQYYSTSGEKAGHPAPGSMVDVDGKMMHVYTEGQGKTTFVILSGGGVGAPVLEYKPLWSRFAEHGRVAVVEYMGYGWSDGTDVPRTSENIVEEIRATLKGAKINPPYILVAHSIGGIYAMKYTQMYGDELDALIALDITLPRGIIQAKAHGQSVQQSLPPFETISLLRKAGIMRVMLWMDPLLVSGAPHGVYSEKEARMIAMVTNWEYANNTVINEFLELEQNMTDLVDVVFPEGLPVLMIHANPPGEQSESNQWFLLERKRLVQNLFHGRVMELPAGHSSIYWVLSDDIVKETLSFLEEAGKS